MADYKRTGRYFKTTETLRFHNNTSRVYEVVSVGTRCEGVLLRRGGWRMKHMRKSVKERDQRLIAVLLKGRVRLVPVVEVEPCT